MDPFVPMYNDAPDTEQVTGRNIRIPDEVEIPTKSQLKVLKKDELIELVIDQAFQIGALLTINRYDGEDKEEEDSI